MLYVGKLESWATNWDLSKCNFISTTEFNFYFKLSFSGCEKLTSVNSGPFPFLLHLCLWSHKCCTAPRHWGSLHCHLSLLTSAMTAPFLTPTGFWLSVSPGHHCILLLIVAKPFQVWQNLKRRKNKAIREVKKKKKTKIKMCYGKKK